MKSLRAETRLPPHEGSRAALPLEAARASRRRHPPRVRQRVARSPRHFDGWYRQMSACWLRRRPASVDNDAGWRPRGPAHRAGTFKATRVGIPSATDPQQPTESEPLGHGHSSFRPGDGA